MQKPPWLNWLVDTGDRLHTVDGRVVEVWEFHHEACQEALSAWATHFRNHYCRDREIDDLRHGTGLSRSEYLTRIKFPDASLGFGPSIRAGDFGEVLVADYLEYILDFWVPRTRYCDKGVRNESEKGCDIIGFKIRGNEKLPVKDTLAIFEAKAQFSGKTSRPRLQDAVNGSAKDPLRKAESLNATKQRLYHEQRLDDVKKVERFQNPEDQPYNEIFGAAALFSLPLYDATRISSTDTTDHPSDGNLLLLVIRGRDMMDLVHSLYRRAADEA